MPETLPSITDPLERAVEAARFLAYAEGRARVGREARNDAIRAAREAWVPRTVIARRLGISVASVKAICA